ncbi:MAG: hypothetical protein ACREIU_11715 [Planctomycetota bacterium]
MTVSLLLLLAQAPTVEEALARHLASLGGREALRGGVGVVGAVGSGSTVLRQSIRFSPPRFREAFFEAMKGFRVVSCGVTVPGRSRMKAEEG